MVSNHLALKWLLSLKDPRERLAGWVLEIQEFDFDILYKKESDLVIPDTLSRDAVRKPLYQRCYGALDSDASEAATRNTTEFVSSVTEMTFTGAGVCIEDIHAAQSAEFGNVAEVAAADKLMMVDEDGVLRIAKDGDLAVVVPKGLQTAVLNHVHGDGPHWALPQAKKHLRVCGEGTGGKSG